MKANAGVHVQAPKPARRSARDARCGSGGEPARDQRRRSADAARSRDARDLLFVGTAARGAREPESRRCRCGGPHRARRRQGLEGAHRAGRQAGARGAAGLACGALRARALRRARAVSVATRHAREPTHRAAPCERVGAASGRADGRAPAHAAAFVRHSRAGIEPRSARRAGDARPREPVDHADLYAPRFPALWPRSTIRRIRARGAARNERPRRPVRRTRKARDAWKNSTPPPSFACAATAASRSAATARSRWATRS